MLPSQTELFVISVCLRCLFDLTTPENVLTRTILGGKRQLEHRCSSRHGFGIDVRELLLSGARLRAVHALTARNRWAAT